MTDMKMQGFVSHTVITCSPLACTSLREWEQLQETSMEKKKAVVFFVFFFKKLAVESLPLPNEPRLVLTALSQSLQQTQVSTGK